MKINYYHNKIKDSLIARLTLVGHNDIINSFKVNTRLRIYLALFRQTIFKWTRHFNNENRFDHPVYTFSLLIIQFVVETFGLRRFFQSLIYVWTDDQTCWRTVWKQCFCNCKFKEIKIAAYIERLPISWGETKHQMGET